MDDYNTTFVIHIIKLFTKLEVETKLHNTKKKSYFKDSRHVISR